MLHNASLKNSLFLITIGILLLPFLDRYFKTHITPKDVYTLGLYWLVCIGLLILLYLFGVLKK